MVDFVKAGGGGFSHWTMACEVIAWPPILPSYTSSTAWV